MEETKNNSIHGIEEPAEKSGESACSGRNPCAVPDGVSPARWAEALTEGFARAYGYLERGKRLFREAVNRAYAEAGVFDAESPDEASNRSGSVTLETVLDNIRENREVFMERFNRLSGSEEKSAGQDEMPDPSGRFADYMAASEAELTGKQ